MNLITMSEEQYWSFFFRPGWGASTLYDALGQAGRTYIESYANSGDVALQNFTVLLSGSNVPALKISTTKSTYNDLHWIRADINTQGTALEIILSNYGKGLVSSIPLNIEFDRYSKTGRLTYDLDIPENDPTWRALGWGPFLTPGETPEEFKRAVQAYGAAVMRIFAEVQTKAFNTRHEVIRIQKEAEDDERRSSTAKGANRPTTSRVVKLTGDITYSIVADTSLPRQFTRHCEAWEVRGHYRHYRSGKVVFVRPHVRGAGAVKDKQYSV